MPKTSLWASVGHVLLLIVLIAVGLGWALGEPPLAGTEGHRALTAHQMAAAGEWLTPSLYGQLYLRKPPLHYWVLILAEKLCGQVNEWVWRMPSLLSAILLALLLYKTAARWWSPRAGLVAGLASLSQLALWSQVRSADIDAVHTLLVTLAALCLLEWFHAEPDRRLRTWRWTVLGGLACGAVLLSKGPAGLPVILGALFGPVLLHGTWGKLKQPHPWAMLLIGALLFSAYVLAIFHQLDVLDKSGLREASDKMTIRSFSHFFQALLLPLVLFAYALPSSLALPVLFLPGVLKKTDLSLHRRVRSIVGALVVSLLISAASGMINPRYAYINLPLFALLAGAVAKSWERGLLPADVRAWLLHLMLFFAIIIALLHLGLAVLLLRCEWTPIVLVTAPVALTALVALVLLLLKQRQAPAMACFVALIALLTIPFAHHKNLNRSRRSGYAAGKELARIIQPNTNVVAGLMLWTQPELFYYAGVQVDVKNRYRFEMPMDLPEDCWIVFHRDEWPAWHYAFPNRLSRIATLPIHAPDTRVAWYSAATNLTNPIQETTSHEP